jgi:hypothetical protein
MIAVTVMQSGLDYDSIHLPNERNEILIKYVAVVLDNFLRSPHNPKRIELWQDSVASPKRERVT